MKIEYPVILFDLGNTLIRFDHTIAVNRLREKFSIDPQTTYSLFFDSELTRLFELGRITQEEFYSRAIKLLQIDIDFDDFISIWNEIFWEDKGSCALARRLKKNRKLFLISNVNKSHYDYINKKFDILSIFDSLILSFEIGAMKPDRCIYDEAIRRSGGDKKNLLYIDDREDLIREAKLIGIDSIRYENSQDLEKALAHKNIVI